MSIGSSHKTRDAIIKKLNVQEAVEGKTADLAMLRKFLDVITTSRQWDAFTRVKHHRYGKMSYETFIFYYPSPELIQLMEPAHA